MQQSDKIRYELAGHLTGALQKSGATYSEISTATHIPFGAVYNATRYGIVDAVDLILICGHIGLDAGAVLAESALHTATKPASASAPASESVDPDRSWQLHTPPASRFVEIHIHGANLIAQYIADRKGYLIGHDSLIPASQVPRWREASEAQLDRLNDHLAREGLSQ